MELAMPRTIRRKKVNSRSNTKVTVQEEPVRHLMVFIDGTWVSASSEQIVDNNLSNVYKLAVSTNTNTDTEDYQAQIGFYISGIGSRGNRLSEGIIATQLPYDVEQAYTNICLNYIPDMGRGAGDKIYLFGFSRGAIIARLVATLISKFGLLRQDQLTYFPDLWKRVFETQSEIEAFKKAHCHQHPDGSYETKVSFLGLFDAVIGRYSGKLKSEINALLQELDAPAQKHRKMRSHPRRRRRAGNLLSTAMERS